MVSVVIPTYNRGWILKEAIESVLAQTFDPYELIVVDDGSTDNTQAILSMFSGIRAVVQENRGVSAARNRGIDVAAGDYLAFLDSDDLWLPQKLASQMAFFKSNPRAMICQTQETWIRNGRRIHPQKKHQKTAGMFFERSLDLCLVSPSAVMMRKELLLDTGRFDENLPACEDYDLWLRIGARYPIFLVDQPLVIKRGGHADQLSAARGLDKHRIRSIQNLLQSDILTMEQQRAAQIVLQKKCRIYATGCQKRGRIQEAEYYRRLAQKWSRET